MYVRVLTKAFSTRTVQSMAARVSGVIVLSCVFASPLIPMAAHAQDTSVAASTQKRSWNFQNAPIQDVLKGLFKSMNLNYIIDQDVVGTVNISLNDISFEVALRAILRSATPPLTYDIENGIYHVKVKRVQESVAASGDAGSKPPDAAVPNKYHLGINWYDVTVIAQLLSSGAGGIITVPVSLGSGSTGGSTGSTGGAGGASGGGGGGFGGGGGGGGFGQH